MLENEHFRRVTGVLGLGLSIAIGSPGIAQASDAVRPQMTLSGLAHSERASNIKRDGHAAIVEAVLMLEEAHGGGPPVAFDPSMMDALSKWVSSRHNEFALAQFQFGENKIAFAAYSPSNGNDTDAYRVGDALKSSNWSGIDTGAIPDSQYISHGVTHVHVSQLEPEQINDIVSQVNIEQNHKAQSASTNRSAMNVLGQITNTVLNHGSGQYLLQNLLGQGLDAVEHHR